MSNKDNEELKLQAMDNTLGLTPVVGIRGKDIFTAARTVLLQAIKQPIHSAKHVAHFSLDGFRRDVRANQRTLDLDLVALLGRYFFTSTNGMPAGQLSRVNKPCL